MTARLAVSSISLRWAGSWSSPWSGFACCSGAWQGAFLQPTEGLAGLPWLWYVSKEGSTAGSKQMGGTEPFYGSESGKLVRNK
jgi:hypothetical protein